MLTVELRNDAGRTPILFDILPASGLPPAVAESQLRLAQRLAPVLGLRYYFLVTGDEIRGWQLPDARPVFRGRTIDLLLPYAGTEEKVRTARAAYLAELVQAWVSDLSSRWKSGRAPAPGENDMGTSGILDVIRSAEPTTSGSL